MLRIQDVTALMLLRMLCGLFFIPHAIGKFTAREAALAFFHAAGFRPATVFRFIALAIEIALIALLLGGLWVRPVAAVAAVYLLIATAAVVKVQRQWLWQLGGCEYALFWGLCCVLVAASA